MPKMPKKKPLRLNVLLLVGSGYITLVFMFIAMSWKGGMTAEDAYEVVKGPLMALIGGSLAIAKDLLSLDQSESSGDHASDKNTDGDENNQQP
jgi:hypothetical protein